MKKMCGIALAMWMVVALTVGGGAWGGGTAEPLKTAPGSEAEKHNQEGIEHYNQHHWDVAQKHFAEAVKADPKSAEAHYNLALALDNANNHKSATEHFNKAYELGKNNPDIRNSGILKDHLK